MPTSSVEHEILFSFSVTDREEAQQIVDLLSQKFPHAFLRSLIGSVADQDQNIPLLLFFDTQKLPPDQVRNLAEFGGSARFARIRPQQEIHEEALLSTIGEVLRDQPDTMLLQLFEMLFDSVPSEQVMNLPLKETLLSKEAPDYALTKESRSAVYRAVIQQLRTDSSVVNPTIGQLLNGFTIKQLSDARKVGKKTIAQLMTKIKQISSKSIQSLE